MTGVPLRVRGARENNLQAVDVDIAPGALIAVCGVSGSGKTSFIFDTLYEESQRRYIEAMGTPIRRAAGALRRPEADLIEGLPPAIALRQGPPPLGRLDDVASISEVLPALRVLWGRCGTLHCPRCDAAIRPSTHDQVVARLVALPPDTRVTLEAPFRAGEDTRATIDEIVRAGFSRIRVGADVLRIEEIDPHRPLTGPLRVVVDRIRMGSDRRDRLYDALRTAGRAGRGVIVAVHDHGVDTFTDRPYCAACDLALPALEPALLNPAGTGRCPACRGQGGGDDADCDACRGTGLHEVARAARWSGRRLLDVLALSVADARRTLADAPTNAVSAVPLAEALRRLDVLAEVGLGRVPLRRRGRALASGEWLRARLARQVGAGLAGVLYLLDEPTAGLATADAQRVVGVLRALCAAGNTVIAVDHGVDILRVADRLLEFGPSAGAGGGRIVFDGSLAQLESADTPTGRWLRGEEAPPVPRRDPVGAIATLTVERDAIRGRFDWQQGALHVVHGVSGSGKSELLRALGDALAARIDGAPPTGDIALRGLDGIRRVLGVERTSALRGGRSMPATFVGLWDTMRELFAATPEAQIRGLGAGMFSLAQKGGRCEACAGEGVRTVDLGLLPEAHPPCDACGGRRFLADVLEVRWKGRSADEILALGAEEARPLLAGHPRLDDALRALCDVGLGYLRLGQPGYTLSGGEAQRLRLARELVRGSRDAAAQVLYLLDDATVGLHPADVDAQMRLLRRLVDQGATVVLATHLDSLAAAADRAHALPPPG